MWFGHEKKGSASPNYQMRPTPTDFVNITESETIGSGEEVQTDDSCRAEIVWVENVPLMIRMLHRHVQQDMSGGKMGRVAQI